MLRGPHARSPRLWFKRYSTAALCSAVVAALSVWSIERRVHESWPWAYSFAVTGTGLHAPIRARPDGADPLAPGEHVVWIAADRYDTGYPYPWLTRIAYFAEWNDPSPPGDGVLPDPARLDDLLLDVVLPLAIRLDVDPAEIDPGALRGRPIYGQRVLGGFDTVGALADVSLFALGVSVLGWVMCVYALVREHVLRAVEAWINDLARKGLSREQRRRGSVLNGVCPDCRYEVDHTKQPRCPECGCDLARVLRDGDI